MMKKKRTYVIRYTNQECRGNNDFLELEIKAADIDEAFEIIDQKYDHLVIDMVFAKPHNYHSEAVAI